MAKANYYDILEISPTASEEVVRSAYKSLAKKYHPDTYNGSAEEATRKMTELNEAYEMLSNPEKRMEYDKKLKQQYTDSSAPPQRGTNNPTATAANNSPKKTESKEGGSGCLSSIVGLLFWVIVISFAIRSCSGSDDNKTVGTSEQQSPTSQAEIVGTYQDKPAIEAPPTVDDEDILSPEAQMAEKLYFHKPYTDIGTVDIHDFSERDKVLEYMASLGTDKSILDTGCSVGYENKLFGKDYYYATASETKYYYAGELKDNKPHGFGAIVGFADGSGTYEFAGEVLFYYVGNFKNGMKDGFGVEFHADECDITQAVQRIASLNLVSDDYGEHLCHYLFNHVAYEGFWKENEHHGKGNEFSFPTYDGIYFFHEEINRPIEGYLFGNAYPDVTSGEWKNGKLDGDVSIYVFNHKKYIGEMKNGKEDGQGTLYHTNNQPEYEGEWKNGSAHGHGSYYDYDGNLIYSGEWKNGNYAH